MITEAYVSFKTAKLLKKKGFDEGCSNTYDTHSEFMSYSNYNIKSSDIWCPTHQLAVAWFREHYGILIFPTHLMNQPLNAGWSADITVGKKELGLQEYFDSYELAVDAALQYSLENLI